MSSKSIQRAVRIVSETYYGENGRWLCLAFDAVNARLFDGELPQPLITIEMTKWSRCLGWCQIEEDRPPHLIVHPTLFGVPDKKAAAPWGLKTAWLGRNLVFDVLLHQCVHLAVHYRLGGYEGPTSHNNDPWIAEVNRLCPLIGIKGVDAGRQVPKRVPAKGAERDRGPTVVKKVDLGNVPFQAAAAFPYGVRIHQRKAASYYRGGRLPLRLMA